MAPQSHLPSAPHRLVTLIVGLVVAGLVLAGCATSTGNATPQGKVSLSFWGWVPGLESAVATWNKANPNIQVKFHRMTGDDGSKIPAAIDAGTAPDIVQMGSASLPQYVVANQLIDISKYIGDIKSKYDSAAWAAVTFGSGIYGVPQDAGPSGMLYRTDIFQKYGIAVPKTWDEYLDAGRKLKAANPDVYLAQFSPNESGFWLQDVWQAGGSFYGTKGNSWTVTVNDAKSKQVAKLWQTALDEKLFKVVDMWTPEYWNEVNAGQIATINYLAWFPALLEQNAPQLAGKWAVVPSPTIGGQDTAGSGGYGANVVPKGTKHVEQAAAFIKWLNTSKAGLKVLVEKGGIFPASLVGLQSANLEKADPYFGGQQINKVFKVAAGKVPSAWTAGPTLTLTQNALADNFAKVGNGDMTMVQALDAVAAKEKQDLLDAGLSVK